MSDLIQIDELGETEIVLIPEAKKLRDDLLVESDAITKIDDAFDAECAAEVLKKISTATNDMESTRKKVKAPVLEIGKRIDGVAKEFANSLLNEKSRIQRLLGAYEAEQRRIRQEAERKEREKQEAARREAEKALESGDLEKAQEAAEKIEKSQEIVVKSAHRPKGTSVRETWKFEVVDIEALFKAAPHLCSIEPNNGLIRETIKTKQDIPGLRIWKEAKSYVR